MAGALSHIRVLDLSCILAGPWAGQILADLEADIKSIGHSAYSQHQINVVRFVRWYVAGGGQERL